MKNKQSDLFGVRLKELMEGRSITSYKLAKDLRCSKSSVANWLSGKVPIASNVVQLAQYFDVPASYLTGETDDPTDRSKTHWAEMIEEHKKTLGVLTDTEYDEVIDAFVSASPELRAAALAVLKSGEHKP